MHCTSIEGGSLPCDNCKECENLTCNNCDFYSTQYGCSVSECIFKYSDANKHQIKEAKQYYDFTRMW